MQRFSYALAVVSALALAVGFATVRARAVDEAALARFGQQARTLAALDFRLTGEVLKARAGLVAHYDGIVQTAAARKRVLHELRLLLPRLPAAHSDSLRAHLGQADAARDALEIGVERFKRENAVLRNSLRFLPLLAAELPAPSSAHQPALGERVPVALAQDELLMQAYGEAAVIARVDRELEQLRALVMSERDVRRSKRAAGLGTLLAHASVIRERTPELNQLLRTIVDQIEGAPTQPLLSELARVVGRANRDAAADARWLFALTLFTLGACATSVILRLRSSAVALRRTGAQLEEAIDSLRAQQAKQRELGELKTRFVAMTSHQFRTPLSVIMSSSEMLEAYAERWSSAKKLEHFARIREAALGMTHMLDAILMIGKSDAGALQFEPQALELGSLCSELARTMAHVNDAAQRLRYTGPSRPLHVRLDPALLRQVLENLLSNALKYSPADAPVELHVGCEGDQLTFRVRDRGIGIAAEDRARLFESFHRGKNVGNVSGTGLGLAVVQRAVELHRGTVTVESELGRGSEFTVRVPAQWVTV